MDFLNDRSGRHLLKLSSAMTLPDYVAKATVDPEAVADLPDHLFAKRATREFPIDEPGHVFLSYAYIQSTAQSEPEIRSRIKSAAEKLGIQADLDRIDQVYAASVKQASEPAAYALQVDFGPADPNAKDEFHKQGGVQKFYPMSTSEQLVKSAGLICEDKARLPLELFAEGCRNLVKRAAALDVPILPRWVCAYGEDRLPDEEFATKAAARRVELTGETLYEELVKAAVANPEQRPMSDYAELMLQIDRTTGLNYDVLPDPFIVLQSGVEKSAYDKELENWFVVADAPVPRGAFEELTEDRVARNFDKEAGAKVLNLVQKSASLSSGDLSRLVEEHLNQGQRRQLLAILSA